MSKQYAVDPRSDPSAPPLFWDYKGAREIDIHPCIADGFGENAQHLRAALKVPGLTWRSTVLGTTVRQDVVRARKEKHRAHTPLLLRGLTVPADRYAGRLVRYRNIDLADPAPADLPPLAPPLQLVERFPEEMFLELFNLPQIVLNATHVTWQAMREQIPQLGIWIRHQMSDFWADVQEYLGDVQTMRERLVAGGLFRDEWKKLNLWVMGTLEVLTPIETPGWLQTLRRAWNWILAHVPFFQKPIGEAPDLPGVPHALRSHSEFHVFGLELETRFGKDLLARSTFGHHRSGLGFESLFLYNPEALPPDLKAETVLRYHADNWLHEHERRQRLYYWSGKIIGLIIETILKYIALGPVGLVIVLLNLLVEGVFLVIRRRKEEVGPALKLVLPTRLPKMETAS